ncbi:hypothetical protein AB835_14555 [Candidatus Endobugula sertula]|uniref:Immunity MXAN-0049 protein domain-containing protein n=1 Tax=Candidatus Endobugula sertula TaxID=62101 RepID=A0A1D2QLC2_9GAMM|nr:hypothetical protein AB835_14555 [Candidatus Endobugula sertula]
MVTTDIRRALLDLDISDFFTHPAVYIHDDGEWYEDYWFCTFTEEFDCWDRETSECECVTLEDYYYDEDVYFISRYRLNEKVLDETPLNKKLLFKMGGCSGILTCHKSIKYLFENEGTELTLVEEW